MFSSYHRFERPCEVKYTIRNRQICREIANEIMARDIDSKEVKSCALSNCIIKAIDNYVEFNQNKFFKYSGLKRVKNLKAKLQQHPENYDEIQKALFKGNEDGSSFKTFFYNQVIKTFCSEEQTKELSANFAEIRSYYEVTMPHHNTLLYQHFLNNLINMVVSLKAKAVTIELPLISHSPGR